MKMKVDFFTSLNIQFLCVISRRGFCYSSSKGPIFFWALDKKPSSIIIKNYKAAELVN